jgi:glycoside/pentoside/hexuronide:cation symporter, GPH family
MTADVLRTADIVKYSTLAIPIAFAGFPLYVLAPDYYATMHGVSLTVLGMLLLGLRVFDAVQDPLIGMLSDRYRHVLPAIMLIASAMLCVGIYGLFNLVIFSPVLWFSLCIAVTVTAYSVLSINLNTLGGLWSDNSTAQTRIAGLREAFGLIGLVVAVSLPVWLKQQIPPSQVYACYALILAVLMSIAWMVFWPWIAARHAAVITPKEKGTYAWRDCLKSIPRETRCFLGIYGLSMLASSLPAVLVIFFVRDLLGAEALTGVFLLFYFLSGAASMPLWKFISTKRGMYTSWALSMVLAVGSFVGAFFLNNGDVWHYALICAVSGLALGADLALPPAILALHIHRHHHTSHAATHYALLALVAKLSLALASAIALPLLDLVGFTPAQHNNHTALLSLSIIYALVPCVLKLIAAGWLAHRFIYSKQGDFHENSQTYRIARSADHA